MRTFASGATRDSDVGKLDYEGYISPLVTKRFGQYMRFHQQQADGSMRGSDNWQSGISRDAYVKSLVRHVEDVKLHHDGFPEEAVDGEYASVLCAVIFNASGLLFELEMERKGRRGASSEVGVAQVAAAAHPR